LSGLAAIEGWQRLKIEPEDLILAPKRLEEEYVASLSIVTQIGFNPKLDIDLFNYTPQFFG